MATKKTTKNTVVYVGPNASILVKGTTYIGGIPSHVESYVQACPALNNLFVETKDLPQVLTKLEDPESAESTFYFAVENYFKGVK